MNLLIKKIGLGLIFLTQATLVICQTNNLDFSAQILNSFSKHILNKPQEKLYLQTDKPYYSAGEEIWFKGYLVNAISHEPNAYSKYIYVELIDKSDSICQRVKIQKDSLGFCGQLKLSAEFPKGNYMLRAYSYWMQNAGDDFFFKKNIYIGNAIDDHINATISYSKSENSKVTATVLFTDGYNNPLIDKNIITTIHSTLKEKKITISTNKLGEASFTFQTDTLTKNKRFVDIEIDDEILSYKKRFILPKVKNDFDIQFFPEGGVLVNNNLQTVGFKAIGTNGLSIEVSGNIMNNAGEVVSEFSSTHKGMGSLVLLTEPGKTYVANVTTATGLTKKIEIKGEEVGVILQTKYYKGKILYEIVNKTDIPPTSLCLLIHCRGRVIAINTLDSLSMAGNIPESILPAGVITLSVINIKTNKILSERLTFVPLTKAPIVKMMSDKKSYGKRDWVNLNFTLINKDSIPLEGDFSLSVTDNQSVKADTLVDNIMTNLLLTSDLKGHIENPGEYFINTNNLTRQKLDLLMLTQGWKRFSTSNVVNNTSTKLQNYLEIGQAVSGKVANLFGKPSANAEVLMFSPTKDGFSIAKTDSLGKFIISGISFADSTSYILKAKKKRNFGDVELIIDKDQFPEVGAVIPTMDMDMTVDKTVSDYLSQSKQKYFSDGGMRVINLKDVTVTAEKNRKKNDEHYYSGMADTSIDADKLAKMPHMSVLDILASMAGVRVSGEEIYIRGSQNQAMIMIDGVETMGANEIQFLTSDDVQEISLFKGASAAVFGLNGGNGVVAITLKTGVANKVPTALSLAVTKPLGYQKPAQFYVPKYEVESVLKSAKSDVRTTIYWNPTLRSDSTGTFSTKFPSADLAHDYNLILEGIAKNGEIVRYVGIIKRNDK